MSDAQNASAPNRKLKQLIAAWITWEGGTAAFNAVITTFVFVPFLTSEKYFGQGADRKLGIALAIAGILVAITAPAAGQNSDRSGRRAFNLRLFTSMLIVVPLILSFIKPDVPAGSHYLLLGLGVIAVGNFIYELAMVNYNAMLNSISTEQNIGKISATSWAAGYFGGIVLLLTLYFGIITPLGDDNLPTAMRYSMLLCVIWMILLMAPLLFLARDDKSTRQEYRRDSLINTYRLIGQQIKMLWREDRRALHFLVAAAVFRDALAGVFTFGGVIAGTVFGFSPTEILLFGVAGNIIAGVVTVSLGFLEDKVGPKLIIIISLSTIFVAGNLVFFLHTHGKIVFWVLGLILSAFVGPAQTAARSYLSRICPPNHEGEIFGLYAFTGRAVSFCSPSLYAFSITLGAILTGVSPNNCSHYGILGLMLLLGIGLVMVLLLPANTDRKKDLSTTY